MLVMNCNLEERGRGRASGGVFDSPGRTKDHAALKLGWCGEHDATEGSKCEKRFGEHFNKLILRDKRIDWVKQKQLMFSS